MGWVKKRCAYNFTLNTPYIKQWFPYPEPVYTGWSNVHWNAIGWHSAHWDATGIIARCTGTPLEKLSWNSLHRNATGETLFQPTHIIKQSSMHASLKWQDDGRPSSNLTSLCRFSFYLEFTALQCIPVLLFKRVSTSTSLCACLGYEHHCRFCVFGVAVQIESA